MAIPDPDSFFSIGKYLDDEKVVGDYEINAERDIIYVEHLFGCPNTKMQFCIEDVGETEVLQTSICQG